MEKMTYVVALNSAIACDALSAEVKEKLSALLTQMEKKSSAIHKPTATQTENEGLKVAIFGGMESGAGYTISELMKLIPELSELTNQRVSAIVRQMVSDGRLTREEIKHKAYFTKVGE